MAGTRGKRSAAAAATNVDKASKQSRRNNTSLSVSKNAVPTKTSKSVHEREEPPVHPPMQEQSNPTNAATGPPPIEFDRDYVEYCIYKSLSGKQPKSGDHYDSKKDLEMFQVWYEKILRNAPDYHEQITCWAKTCRVKYPFEDEQDDSSGDGEDDKKMEPEH